MGDVRRRRSTSATARSAVARPPGGGARPTCALAPGDRAAGEAELTEIVRWRRAHQPGGTERRLGVHQPARRLGRPPHRRRRAARASASARPRCRPSTPTSSRPTAGGSADDVHRPHGESSSTGSPRRSGVAPARRDPPGRLRPGRPPMKLPATLDLRRRRAPAPTPRRRRLRVRRGRRSRRRRARRRLGVGRGRRWRATDGRGPNLSGRTGRRRPARRLAPAAGRVADERGRPDLDA